jgi:hypothetical protein
MGIPVTVVGNLLSIYSGYAQICPVTLQQHYTRMP